IINSLKNLGKSYSNQELVRKILRCLPKSWTTKVTAIEEAKDLSNLPLEQLLGSLMTHETTMKNHENVEVKKKKTIALKALRKESESDEDDDIILISKQFKKFLKSQEGKKAFKKKVSQDEESSKREEPTCFECKNPGHFKNECPYLKKKEKFNKEHFKKKNEQSKKKKAMVATWDDSDPSSSEKEESDEEVVNLALMAMEEDTSGDESESEVNFIFDELQNAYEKLYIEYENVRLKNKTLKKNAIKNSFYENENEILNVSSKLSIDFMEENEKLKIEIDALKKSFSTFSNSSDKLDNLLGLQRCVFDKAGLGYEQMKNVKHFKNFFVK
ncbi:zf-CCHC domain-containing protein/UBN2 domain-containing protein, partial [Cephalotus follicularis]